MFSLLLNDSKGLSGDFHWLVAHDLPRTIAERMGGSPLLQRAECSRVILFCHGLPSMLGHGQNTRGSSRVGGNESNSVAPEEPVS